ncbi:MAG: FG-GAP-like repeat-containing protein [Myxococcota bacterium]
MFPGAGETWEDGFTDNDCDGELEDVTLEYGATSWTGEREGAEVGRRVSPLGDVTADGLADYLTGGVYDSGFYENGGIVYLVSGNSGGSLAGNATLVPSGSQWFLGSAIDGGPDVDADDLPDIVVSATGFDGGTGKTWLVSGVSLATGAAVEPEGHAIGSVTGNEPGGYAGSSAAFLGDIMGSGEEWLAMAAQLADVSPMDDVGTVGFFVASSIADVNLSDADFSLSGYYAGESLGSDVDSAGDIDGDGLEDYFISASTGDLAYVLPGGNASPVLPDDAIFRLTGTGAGEFGIAGMVGDIDGDGRRDLACIVEDETTYFYTQLSSARVRSISEASATVRNGAGSFAFDVADLGDLDEDGRDETFVVVSIFGDLGTSVSAVQTGESLAFGADLSVEDAALKAVSTRAATGFGYRIAVVGDVDGNGGDDLVYGGPSDDEGGERAGAVVTIPVPR